MSFTSNYDKEAFWKIYGDICVKTTVGSIFDTLKNFTAQEWTNDFIGKVKYVDYLDEEPKKIFYEVDKTEYPDYMYAAFIKRKEFAYEEETRVILFAHTNTVIPRPNILVPVDLSFIKEIILSPYVSSSKLNEVENLCRKNGVIVPIQISGLFKKLDERTMPLPSENDMYWGCPRK